MPIEALTLDERRALVLNYADDQGWDVVLWHEGLRSRYDACNHDVYAVIDLVHRLPGSIFCLEKLCIVGPDWAVESKVEPRAFKTIHDLALAVSLVDNDHAVVCRPDRPVRDAEKDALGLLGVVYEARFYPRHRDNLAPRYDPLSATAPVDVQGRVV